MESARQATDADLPRLVELWESATMEFDLQRGGRLLGAALRRPPPIDASLAADIADPDRVVVAGTLDDVVIGFGVARADRIGAHLVGVVESLYVEPEGRGVGVGEAMMNLILASPVTAGCASVDATALPGNRQAKGFFERHGFTARLLVMNRSVAPASTAAEPASRP